jgi:hypothetical protein
MTRNEDEIMTRYGLWLALILALGFVVTMPRGAIACPS